jgi:hypothetical protein
MKYHKIILPGLFIYMALSISCSRVSWAAFTTPKDNIENIPKALSFLKVSSTNDFRIVEFDDKNYMAFFVNRGITMEKSISEKQLNIKLVDAKQNIQAAEAIGEITDIKSGDWDLIQYTPGVNEPDIVTATFILDAINKLKDSRKYEIYSQTHPSGARYFVVIHK